MMEKLFTRSQQRSLDAKGRLMLPPEYREGLARNNEQGSFWLTCYYGRLVAYLPSSWDNFVEKLNNIGNPSLNIVRFKFKVMGLAEELSCDHQGRVRIPQPLITAAGLKKDVMLVGMFDRFEIWDLEAFNAIVPEDVSGELAEKGISLAI